MSRFSHAISPVCHLKYLYSCFYFPLLFSGCYNSSFFAFFKFILQICVVIIIIRIIISSISNDVLVVCIIIRMCGRLSIVYRSYLSPIDQDFFSSRGCLNITVWMYTKRMEKKLDGNYTRMLGVILNKSWKQHLMKEQLYCHLPPISQTIQVR